MEVRLKVLVGSSAGQSIKIAGPKFYVGRSEDCQLRPRSDLISRHHCAIIIEGDYVAVRDFGSKNGTYVNDERVTSETQLQPGDHLKIGPLEFEVCMDHLGGAKKPKVHSIKEAAARTADSGVATPKENPDDIDLSEWLGEDFDADTREMPSPTDTTEVSLEELTGGTAPAPPPKAEAKDNSDGSSESAAAEMLRKLRKYR